jgi:hypothetical protein
MRLMDSIKATIREYITENISENDFRDIIYGDNFKIFKNNIKSYHSRIEDGLIVKFYLNEYLKHYDVKELDNLTSWNEFTNAVYNKWEEQRTLNQQIVFRRGFEETNNMFFSTNINVASVYGGVLNAYLFNANYPYVLDCKGSSWIDIDEPNIMRGVSHDGKVSTDNVVDFMRGEGFDGVVFLNLYEGSGADVFGSSNIYVTFNKDNVINLTNN